MALGRFGGLLLGLASLALAATAQAADKPMSFQLAGNGGNCDSCSWIAADGAITSDTPARFEAFLTAEKITYNATVAFNSPGGDLAAGLKLGELIRKRRMDTTVFTTEPEPSQPVYSTDTPGMCASACAYAFLGGVSRQVSDGSRIGVHQFSSTMAEASESETQRSLAVLAAYMGRMGVSRDLILPAGLFGPSDMYWLNRADLEKLNVVTDRKNTPDADWQLTEIAGTLALEVSQTRTDGVQIMYVLRCGPDTTAYTLVWGLDLAGRSHAEAQVIAESISGFSLRSAAGTLAQTFTTPGSSSKSLVMVGARAPRTLLRSLANSPETVELALDMPRMMIGYVGGWGQPFPRSNLRKLLPLLDRNCRSS